MKALVCEMCNSVDLVKQDGLYICQACGTKYTAEEAKKMMVDISGSTVKIDHSDELEKLYQAARNARETSDDESAIRHYESISANDPSSWEALFYLVVLKTNSIKNSQIGSAAIGVSNCLPKVFELINSTISDEAEKKATVQEVVEQCYETASWLTNASESFYRSMTKGNGMMALTSISGALHSAVSTGTEIGEDQKRRLHAANILYYCGNLIESTFSMQDQDYRTLALWCWETVFEFNKLCKARHNSNMMDKDSIYRLASTIRKYDPTFVDPTNTKQPQRSSHSSSQQSKSSTAVGPVILGVLGIVFAFLLALVGHVLSIIGIIYGAKEYKENGKSVGLIISSIGEALAIISSIAGIMMSL